MESKDKFELIEEALLESVVGGVLESNSCGICNCDGCSWPCFFDWDTCGLCRN
ncbi:hypothetical protein L2725_12075 [Shewanella corallii]|uniref:Uncharacterized protein n=1 Tax=Shewanella corallii TaxID=560080 RepID=A0ABT0N7R2_9GAMM|nr:hypothetical protein [Shewanella corallii]MCL2914503.1 hypothetical protein [Shewanella corallii]